MLPDIRRPNIDVQMIEFEENSRFSKYDILQFLSSLGLYCGQDISSDYMESSNHMYQIRPLEHFEYTNREEEYVVIKLACGRLRYGYEPVPTRNRRGRYITTEEGKWRRRRRS